MKRLPEWIRARVVLAGSPVKGLAIKTSIKTTFKNPFDSVWGPSDEEGAVLVRRSDLLGQADADRRLFCMDYGDPESDGSGRVEVSVEDVDRLKRALNGYKRYSAAYEFPVGYRAMLLEAKRIMATLRKAVPALAVEFEGGDCAVVGAADWGAG